MTTTSSAARAEWSRRLARALVAGGFISDTTIAPLLTEAASSDTALATVLIRRDAAFAGVVVNTLGQLARLPTMNLRTDRPSAEVFGMLPHQLAVEHRAVPIRSVGRQLVVAFAEPPEHDDVRALSDIVGYEIVSVLADPVVIEAMLDSPNPPAPNPQPSPAQPSPAQPSPSQPSPAQPSAARASAGHPVNGVAGNGHVGNGSAGNGHLGGTAVDSEDTLTPRHARRSGDADAGAAGPGTSDNLGPGPAAFEHQPEMVPSGSTGTRGPTSATPVPPPSIVPPIPEGRLSPDRNRRSTTGFGLHIDDLLSHVVSIGASDLHLTANWPPSVRLHGALAPIPGVESLDPDTLREMVYGIIPQAQRERFEAEHELDTSHSVPGIGRFRVNMALQRGTITVALRPIPYEIPEFETLGLPAAVRDFANLRRGLVLVTGPTGSGKSTSLASLIDIINRTKPLHIVTVEDPIEFLHPNKRCVISQREVGEDTASFSEALRRVLRQDPDVVLVGELRDLETISTALTAAETGHLVFATLHTQDAPSTIDRVIDVFPSSQQEQIRIQLGSCLAGVVTQQLVPTSDGAGRAPAVEVLVCTPAVQNLIRGAKTHQVYSHMQTGSHFGMQTMDQSLAILVQQRRITPDMAKDRCRNEDDFLNHLNSAR